MSFNSHTIMLGYVLLYHNWCKFYVQVMRFPFYLSLTHFLNFEVMSLGCRILPRELFNPISISLGSTCSCWICHLLKYLWMTFYCFTLNIHLYWVYLYLSHIFLRLICPIFKDTFFIRDFITFVISIEGSLLLYTNSLLYGVYTVL